MNDAQQRLNGLAVVQAIKDSQDNFAIRMELFHVVAAEIKAKYDALVGAGFTAEQALDICKARAM